jgi:ABC-2 type transport system permease protein
MRKTLDIAINDLRIFLKDPGAIIGAFAVPIVMGVIFGFALSGGGQPSQLRVDVIDNDQSARSAQFLTELRAANTALVLCPADNTDDNYCQIEEGEVLTDEIAVDRLMDNTSLALIEIPAGFGDALDEGQPATIVYRSNENASAPSYILQAVQAVVQQMGGAQVAADVGEKLIAESGVIPLDDEAQRQDFRRAVYENAAATWSIKPFTVRYVETNAMTTNQPSARQQGFGQSIPGMASMFVMFFTLLSSLNILRERKNWTIQRLVTMPVSRAQILGGKILMYFLLGMLQFLALFVIARLLGMSWGNDILALLLVMVSYALCTTALGFMIGTFITTEMQGAAMLNLLGLTLAPLGGAWWPLEITPPFMQTIGHISPVAWAMNGFHTLLYDQGTLTDVLLPIGVLLAAAGVFFVIAIRRFKFT